MTRIIGIDPGSRRTGYGVIDVVGSKISYVTSGIIRLPEGALPERPEYKWLEAQINEQHPQPRWMRMMNVAEEKGLRFMRKEGDEQE